MQAQQTITACDDTELGEPIRAWIEGGDGAIVRGLVDVLSEDGAIVLLTDLDSVRTGDAVTVRLSFSRTARTLAAGARVLSIRSQDRLSECEVEWIPGPERSRLASFVAALG